MKEFLTILILAGLVAGCASENTISFKGYEFEKGGKALVLVRELDEPEPTNWYLDDINTLTALVTQQSWV